MKPLHHAWPFWVRAILLAGILGIVSGAALISYHLYRRPTVLTLAVGSSDGGAKQIASVIAGRFATTGSPVLLKVKNVGKINHDFEIKGRKTRLLSPGQSATLRVTFLRKGSYPYKCTVPGHAAAGMKGVFKIT